MDSKGGNPFLMDDDGTDTNDTMTGQTSNPFLQDFTDTEPAAGGENPFLNFAGDQSYQSTITVDSTNPFASFATDTTAPSTGFEATTTTTTTDTSSVNIFSDQGTNIFVTTSESSTNLFEAAAPAQPSQEIFGQAAASPAPPPPTPAQAKNGKPAPSRPPPPRPQPPAPPKNTKDLILSVTGAMDATSNHLLDRLQVSIRPLVSWPCLWNAEYHMVSLI